MKCYLPKHQLPTDAVEMDGGGWEHDRFAAAQAADQHCWQAIEYPAEMIVALVSDDGHETRWRVVVSHEPVFRAYRADS